MNRFLIFILTIAMGSLLSLNVWGAPVRGRILSDISLVEDRGCPKISIGMTLPIRYMRHFPATHGTELRITVMPIRVSQVDREALRERESFSPPFSNIVPIQEITYEGDIVGDPNITLFFRKDVEFKVEQGQDYRSLTVFIITPENAGACVDLSEAAPPTKLIIGESEQAELMREAEEAFVSENFRRAIQLYTKVLNYPDSAYYQQALELLGLARERNGQRAHAKATYDKYLERYPEGEDADRVRQRLAGLITAREKPKEPLRPVTEEKEEIPEPEWEFYGGISQFYSRDESTTTQGDFEETSLNLSSLNNNIDISGRRLGEVYDLRARFSGGYLYDFLDDDDNEIEEIQISTLNFDAVNLETLNSILIGRQSQSSGGVLGRFDGIFAGRTLTEQVRLNLVTGFSVFSSTISEIDTDRYFYGLNTDLGTYADAWDFNLYIIEQRNKSILDRRAIGGEARFFEANRSLFSLIDYDIFYDDLNTFFLLGNWTVESGRTYNLTLDFRNSPILTTTNAIQSQQFETLQELLDRTDLTEEEIRELAEDRTARSKTFTLGIVQPVKKDIQLSGDFTASELTGTPESGGVEAIEGTGGVYSYFIQATGNNLIKQGDIGIVGLRYTNSRDNNALTLSVDTRYPFTRDFKLNPRLQARYRENDDNTEQWFIRPSVRLDYRGTRRFRTEFELGGEISSRDLADDTSDTRGYFLTIGYRYDF